MLREALFPRARVPGADHGAVGRRSGQQPAAGLARGDRAARPGRRRARRQPARLAGLEAEGLPYGPELRDLSWRAKQLQFRIIARSQRRGCPIFCSNIWTAALTTK